MDRSPARLTWRQVMAWRTERHQLHRRAARAKMLDVIARIGGLHAQLLSSAELMLWHAVFSKDPRYPKQLVEGITEALDSRILTREALADEGSRITGSAELGAKIRQS